MNGTRHAGDAEAAQAQADLLVAYNDVVGRTPTASVVGDLGGQTLTPGVYNSATSMGLNGTLTLDGQGDPTSVFIFQIGSTLITQTSSDVNLINGAQASNVFWQVGSSATALGLTSHFTGTILALTSITVGAGTIINGRALALNGAVTLDTDTFTDPLTLSITGGSTSSTKDLTPTISGTTDAAAGSTVTVRVTGPGVGSTLTTSVRAGGAWSLTVLTPLAEGTYSVVASASDLAGNLGRAAQNLQVDTTAPTVTITGGPTVFTGDRTPTITGTAIAPVGSTVTVMVDGLRLTTTVQGGGTWTVTAMPLAVGVYDVVVSVADQAGNIGTASQLLNLRAARNTTPAQTVTPGGRITVIGHGFDPFERVEVWLDGGTLRSDAGLVLTDAGLVRTDGGSVRTDPGSVLLGTLNADEQGRIGQTFTVPANTSIDIHRIVLIGPTGVELTSQKITVVDELALTGTELTPLWFAVAFLLLGGLAVAFRARSRLPRSRSPAGGTEGQLALARGEPAQGADLVSPSCPRPATTSRIRALPRSRCGGRWAAVPWTDRMAPVASRYTRPSSSFVALVSRTDWRVPLGRNA